MEHGLYTYGKLCLEKDVQERELPTTHTHTHTQVHACIQLDEN